MNWIIGERLVLLMALQASDSGKNFATLRVLRKLREGLSFSSDELKESKLEFNEATGMYNWGTNINKEFDFDETETELLVKALEALSEKEAATEAHLAVYDKLTGVAPE